jgi:meso-butanediol dehydrogenase / (S,S)-butanediol dehydrogenase / diacetyl reductase
MGKLQGKRVIITGGSTGIGAAIVARFLDEGATVVTWCRDRGRGEAIKAVLPKLADVALVDLAEPEAVAAAFTRSLSVLDGALDIMICNAGISIRHDFTAITPEEFDRVMRVNLYGSFYASQHAARAMLAASGGTILFTASTSGVAGYRFYADYNASKGAIIAMMRTMALELAPKVRVNAVNPGYTLTPMQEAEYSPAMLQRVNDAIPMGRHARPAELAGLFAYLASDEAAYATGQVFTLDGGESTGTLAGNLSMSE